MNNQTPTALFLSRLAPSGRRPLRSQLGTVRKLLKWKGEVEDQPFHTLNYAQIEYIKRHKLDEGKSPRTINLVLFALKAIVKTGFLMGVVDDMQWRQVQAIKRLAINPSTKGKALSSCSVGQLINTCYLDKRYIGKRDCCILAIFLSTGLRRFELANLTVSDIQLDKHTLTVKSGKGKKPRKQPIPKWALTYITNWLNVRSHQAGSLFNPIWNNVIKPDRGLSSAALYQIVKARTLAATGITISPHDLRRTFITELLNQSVDLSTASKLAGHANVTTTQIYDKRDESVMKEAIDLLNYQLDDPLNGENHD
ncbi:site-specific integrase [Shewanella sp. 6_MG-2023]|uniref:tyrosine-type recombinase/integrase n=1 Tax=Shewanella sp. 6_MG-2023 TaxID=3062660 RepID=UPI0026E48CE5|nr:site-specific integrase [Shewanella sp. 6_MG-2023]MDO6620233.1 site-specific integrase [Shewanella sp. 6_MG-2023]